MTNHTSVRFWRCFDSLSPDLQSLARHKFEFFHRDPDHPSLHFKPIGGDRWSVRVNKRIRAVCHREDDVLLWFFIDGRDEYEQVTAGR